MDAKILHRPFRFLHVADLHIDRPVTGVTDAPEHLIDLLVDCPLQAAARVFDAALDQQVSFVVLAGDMIDPTCASPREWLFLVEQFQRLAERNITVYWCGGSVDSIHSWPDYVQWPNNVRLFPGGRTERFRHEVGGTTICEVIGRSRDAAGTPRAYEFTPSEADVFSIAVAHADWNCAALGEIGIDYWALGGAHQRSTPLESNCVAHYAGTPQGRNAQETGPHGCTLVAVDDQARIRLTPLTCDVVRWQMPRLSWMESGNFLRSDHRKLEQLLQQRTTELLAESPSVTHLLDWKIACQGGLRSAMRQGSIAVDLQTKLQTEFGHRTPPCWTVAVETDLPEDLPSEWLDEETIRGDFLRSIRQLIGGESAVGLDNLNTEAERLVVDLPPNLLSPNAAFDIRPETTRGVLQDAAWLGADLLSPQEAAR